MTEQIRKFKEYFPITKPATNTAVDYVVTSLDSIVLLTRMIDKNPFFLKEIEGGGLGAGASRSATSDIPEPTPTFGISDHDYRNGQFSFTEKLKGILQSRVITRYQQLSEIAAPFVGAETVEMAVVKCREMCRMMLEDVEEDRDYYRKGFAKEQIDIVPISVDTYLRYFVLEMENLSSLLRSRAPRLTNAAASSSSSAAALPLAEGDMSNPNHDIPQTEEELLTVAFQLMENVMVMKTRWSKYSQSMPINVSAWFGSFVYRWLSLTETKTLEWVENAIKVDTFELTSKAGSSSDVAHSSSVTDLFTAIFQAITYLQNLVKDWPNEIQRASFITKFAQISWKAISQYCDLLDKKDEEVHNATRTEQQSTTAEESGAMSSMLKWFASAPTDQKQNSGAATRSDIIALTCIFLRNLDALNKRLNTLYEEMHGSKVERTAEGWRKAKKEAIAKDTKKGVTGALKLLIICAEDLKTRPGLLTGKTDPYITVRLLASSATDKEIGRTSVCHSTLNPQYQSWNPQANKLAASMNMRRRKAFPFLLDASYSIFTVNEVEQLDLSVYHRAEAPSFQFISASNDTLLGQGNIHLKMGDLARGREVQQWVELTPQGRALVELQLLTEGIPGVDDTSFGLCGVEDVDFWFLRMESAINWNRNNIVARMVGKVFE